jgi:prepilin-type N-terminal cleavage/methylation domain-containing protein
MSRKQHPGFTLVELLVVIAIIAILSLIALPNFLSAQTRAKTSRAYADLRVLAGALCAYHDDNLAYPPNDGSFNNPPIPLSTPIAYITEALLVDPFAERVAKRKTLWSAEDRYYTYMKIVEIDEAIARQNEGFPCPHEAIDHWSKNPGAIAKYGGWRLVCVGPDGKYLDESFPYPLRGSDVVYDPTNGSASFGNILWTEKESPGDQKNL